MLGEDSDPALMLHSCESRSEPPGSYIPWGLRTITLCHPVRGTEPSPQPRTPSGTLSLHPAERKGQDTGASHCSPAGGCSA